ncbi:hypothetical protein CCYN49044_200119 [Capnocytophaga cynodegmi]|uniref:Uncharacterized protein n=1 Tax=Capnocytophaga cynodegmi TaxID=28189 RepID=A0A0B7HJD4_9FLAO|nr:hypothetical protein CCYN74_100121 [Capnocytophaga cynodegmi]CEN38027.1 hypothetical protein CCYN49044_200119 [Capnocytophaga cynodegmi]
MKNFNLFNNKLDNYVWTMKLFLFFFAFVSKKIELKNQFLKQFISTKKINKNNLICTQLK